MTKNNCLLILFLLFGYSLSAQMAFFIKPRVMMKTTRSFHLSEGFFENADAKNYATNDYYTFVNNGHHFSNSKVNLGISAGVKFDDKNSLELVVSADASSVSQTFVYYNLTVQNTVRRSGLLWGRDFTRVNLEYNRTYLIKPYVELRSMLGAGVYLLHKRTEELNRSLENHVFVGGVRRTNLNANSMAAIFQAGLGVDFKTKRGVPLFSLDVFATLNFRTKTQIVRYEVALQDKTDGSIHEFSHTLASRGSGINFQLSRPIQFYPWRPNKKEKL